MTTPVLELHQASSELITLFIDPLDLTLDPTTQVRIEFREDLDEPPAGVMTTQSGEITVSGQNVILNFSYSWLRSLRFLGPRRVVTLYGTVVMLGIEMGSSDLNLRITRSFTTGAL